MSIDSRTLSYDLDYLKADDVSEDEADVLGVPLNVWR
jgi:hypothetical protein